MNPIVDLLERLEPPWKARALCRLKGLPIDTFFPTGGGEWLETRYARLGMICQACEVRSECLDAALDAEGDVGHSHRYGYVGGMTARQRAREAARRAGRAS